MGRRDGESVTIINRLLLELGRVEIAGPPADETVERALDVVAYPPDALVLAEAIDAEPDWFVTHDKDGRPISEPQRTAGSRSPPPLPFRIGTPGDLIQAMSDEFTLSEN